MDKTEIIEAMEVIAKTSSDDNAKIKALIFLFQEKDRAEYAEKSKEHAEEMAKALVAGMSMGR